MEILVELLQKMLASNARFKVPASQSCRVLEVSRASDYTSVAALSNSALDRACYKVGVEKSLKPA